MNNKLLEVDNLHISYGLKPAVSNLSFSVSKGEIFCLAGESGCGKSTVLKAIMGADTSAAVTEGKIRYEGREIQSLKKSRRREIWGTQIGMIYQNPGNSFNPIRSYEKQFREMLKSHGLYQKAEFRAQIAELFQKLGLSNPERILHSCPYEMSGGMNQRIAIAAGVLMRPQLLLADEPTSALDVTMQKQVAEELLRIKKLSNMSVLIVTHNLGLANFLADRIGIMYAGRLVELGSREAVLYHPVHPYTKSLIAAIPKLDGQIPQGLEGQAPLFGAAAGGCAFCERCQDAKAVCSELPYKMQEITPDHWSCCGGKVYE